MPTPRWEASAAPGIALGSRSLPPGDEIGHSGAMRAADAWPRIFT